MNRTILLGANNRFSTKVNKCGFTITGMLFLINGIFQVLIDVASPIGLILGIIMIPGGIGYIIYGLLAFSKSSRYAPRVSINNETLLLKNNLQKSPVIFSWDQIKKISVSSYVIKFLMLDTEYVFSYEANDSISISIKSAIREFAESKQIEVIGG